MQFRAIIANKTLLDTFILFDNNFYSLYIAFRFASVKLPYAPIMLSSLQTEQHYKSNLVFGPAYFLYNWWKRAR